MNLSFDEALPVIFMALMGIAMLIYVVSVSAIVGAATFEAMSAVRISS